MIDLIFLHQMNPYSIMSEMVHRGEFTMAYFLGISVDWSLIALLAGIICAFILLVFSLISTRRVSRQNKIKYEKKSIIPPK